MLIKEEAESYRQRSIGGKSCRIVETTYFGDTGCGFGRNNRLRKLIFNFPYVIFIMYGTFYLSITERKSHI